MQLYLAGYKAQKKTLSYTKPKRKAFTTEANKEALRIKKALISTFRYTECTPSNVQHLAVCGISLDEEYGIERLTPGDASATEKRRCHVQSICWSRRINAMQVAITCNKLRNCRGTAAKRGPKKLDVELPFEFSG